jgi:hypothetical protein
MRETNRWRKVEDGRGLARDSNGGMWGCDIFGHWMSGATGRSGHSGQSNDVELQ